MIEICQKLVNFWIELLIVSMLKKL